jgi:hypothetical protein
MWQAEDGTWTPLTLGIEGYPPGRLWQPDDPSSTSADPTAGAPSEAPIGTGHDPAADHHDPAADDPDPRPPHQEPGEGRL